MTTRDKTSSSSSEPHDLAARVHALIPLWRTRMDAAWRGHAVDRAYRTCADELEDALNGTVRGSELTALAASEASVRKLELIIRTVRNIPAFGAYIGGTAKTGKAHILVNMDGLLWASVEEEPGEFRRAFIDSLAHEFIHALEDQFGLLFDEDAVEAAIAQVRTQRESKSHD